MKTNSFFVLLLAVAIASCTPSPPVEKLTAAYNDTIMSLRIEVDMKQAVIDEQAKALRSQEEALEAQEREIKQITKNLW